jgi:hypothetical protein
MQEINEFMQEVNSGSHFHSRRHAKAVLPLSGAD